MTDQQQRKGPGQGIYQIVHRISRLVMDALQSRVQLATIELEEQRSLFFQLFIVAGLALLLAAFGLITLVVLLCWVISPEYRLVALTVTIITLFFLSAVCTFWVLKKARKTPFLPETRRQLYLDSQSLKNASDE